MVRIWRALALAALSLPVVYPSAATAVPAPPVLTLVVLNPDGSPALDAVAMSRIAEDSRDGVRAITAYESSPNASGVLKVRIPVTDPYIKANPAKKTFAVDISIFTFHDLVTRRVKAYNALNYVLNIGDSTLPKDPSGLNNSVIQLQAVPRSPFGGAQNEEPIPNMNTCNEPANGQPACIRVTHPSEVQATPVVLAHNVGAGVDFTTKFLVAATAKAGTTTVSGVDGLFLEKKGHDSLSTSVSDYWPFYSEGVSSPNEDAAVLTNFAKIETRFCWATGCSTETEYRPDDVVGQSALLPTEEQIFHDYARDPSISNTDCTVRVTGPYWKHTNTVQKGESWSFGFDFQGQYKVFTLHATSVTTNANVETLTTSYIWEKTGNSRTFHHVFVPLGHVSTGADVASMCPHNSPGSTWTDAAYINKENPHRPETIEAPPDAPEPVRNGVKEGQEEANEQARRCEAAPERCGRDY